MKFPNRVKKVFLLWLPVFFWMSVIYFLSERQKIQVSELDMLNFIFFKSLHVIEYALLYVLIYRAIKNTDKKHPDMHLFFLAFLCTVLYGALDEMHQTYVPTREGAIRDVIIDGLGALIAWISIRQLPQRAPSKLKTLAKKLQIL